MLLFAALVVPWATHAQDDCTPISTFPVTYGFEASEGFTTTVTAAAACTTNVFNSCWRNEQTSFNGTTGSGRIWHIYGGTSATYLHSGEHSLMLPDKGSTSAVSTTMLTFPPMNFTNSGGYVVSFWIQRNGTGTSTPEGFKIYASDTDTIGPNAVELGHYSRHRTMPYPCIESAAGWYQYETAPITMTGTVYIIFEGQSYYGSSTYIDDVVIMESPTCIRVNDLAIDASQTTTNSLTLTWTDAYNTGATYSIYNFTATDTTLVQSGVTDTFYTVTGLNPATYYTFAVVSDCGGGDTSMFSTFASAYTACADITANDLPYIEDFEAYGTGSASPISPCWHKGVVAITGSGTTTNFPYPYSTAAINGNRGLYFYAATTTSTSYYNWLVMPPIDASLNMSDLMVSFNLKRTATASHQTTLVVGVTTDYTSTAGFVPVDTIELTSAGVGTIHNLEVSFANYAGTGRYILFYAPAPSAATTYNAFYIDDIVLREIPTCFWPNNVVLNSVSVDEAEISWTPDPRTSNPASWNIEYGEHGFTRGTGITETAYGTFVNLTNLDDNTEYDVYISANCGTEESDPAMFTFRTMCSFIGQLPFTEGFESADVGSTTSSSFVNCLTRLNNATQYFGCPYVSSTASYCHTGARALYWTNSVTAGTYGDYQYVVMPGIDTDQYNINELQFKFWARATGTSYHPVFQVGVMTNPNDVTTFQLVESVNVEGTTYEEYTATLGTFQGNGNYIALRALRPSSTWYATVDDITIEEMPNCPPVVDLEAVATVGNALLTWDFMAGYDEPDGYEITFDSIGGTSPTTVSVTDPTVTLTGLEPRTNYKVYVRAECGSDYGMADSVVFTTGPFSYIELGGGTTNSYYLPIGNYYNYSYTQQLVLASEMSGAATITGIDFDYAYSSPMTSKTNVSIYLANVSATSLSSGFVTYDASTFKLVYTGNLNCTQGWSHFQFDTAFSYDGTSNLLIVVHDNSGSYNGSAYIFHAHSSTGKGRYVQNDSNPYTLSSVTGGTSVTYRANMRLNYADAGDIVCAAPAATVTGASSTTVDISWIPGYNETQWDLSYREAGTTTWTEAATGVATTEYQFTNLTPGTDYEFRVSFECSDNTVYENIVAARTVCSFVTIPYSYNFDDLPTGTTTAHPDIPCWTHINNGSSYFGYPYPSSTTPHSGARSLYWYGSTTTGTYADYEVVVLPPVDTNDHPIRTLQLSFWARTSSVSYAPVFLVGVMSDPNNINTFEYVDSVIVDHITTDWNLYEVSFNHYVGEGNYIAVRANRPTSTWYAYTDDFTLDVLPSCPHVTHLTVDSVSQNSVSLSWTPGGEEIDWSVTDGTNYYTTTTPYITISNLATNTAYTFEVRALCDADDSSAVWSISTRTECEPYLVLPFVENFDSYTTSTTAATGVEIPCWGRLMTGTATYQTGSYLPMVYYYSNTSSAVYTHSGNYSMRLYGIGYHTLPQLPCPADSVTIGFWAKSTSSSYKLYLGVMSDPNNANTFDTIQEITYSAYTAAGAFQYFEINLSNYTGTGRYLAFRNVYTTTTTYYSYHYIDDIEVWHNTNCPAPAVNLGNVTNNSIDVSWIDTTGNSYTSGVTVYWSTDNNISHAQSAVVSTGNSYTITGLSGSTDYWIWIAGECSNEPSRPVMLTATTLSNCGVVENLTLNGVDYNSFGISWGAPTIGDAATGYVVYIRKCTNTPWTNSPSWIIDTTNNSYYFFTGLEAGTTYAYAVRTLCGSDQADYEGGYVTTTICEMDTVGDYATNYSVLPIGATGAYCYSQQIYHSSELAGIDSINSIAFYQRGYDYNDRNVTIYLGETSMNTFETTTSFLPLSRLTPVYTGMMSGFGWVNMKFDTTFVRHADSNLVVVVDDNTGITYPANSYWACSNFGDQYYSLYSYGSSDYNPASISSMSRSYYRNYIVFGNAACEQDECAVPIVVQTATYSDHVDILWNAINNTSYDIAYRTLGADSWTTVATGNNTGVASVTGLGAAFLGEVRVSYICNGNTVSGTTQIQTLCGSANLPIIEDFQSCDYGHYTRSCWITGITNPSAADREYPYITSLTGDEDNMLCFMRYGAYVILPQVDTNLSACQIRFKLTQGNNDAHIFFGLIDDATMPIQTMHVLDTLCRYDYDTTSSTVSITYSFANIPTAYQNSRIAFWDGMESYSFIDDIVVELIPACTPAADLSATATTNTATISWNTNGDNATSYYVVYGPRNFAAGQGDTMVATGSPVTLTGLNHSTNYDAYVYTVCDLLNATSSASNVVQFTTDCAPYTVLPYVMDFENIMPAGSSAAGYMPNCWVSASATSAYIVYTTTSSYVSSPQHAFYMYENGVVALPEMGVPLNTLMLSFHEYNANPQTNGLIIGTVDNVNTGFAQTFVPYDTIVFTNNQNIYNVVSYMVDYTGTANRLAIKNYNTGTGNTSVHYIDDLVIDLAPACIPIQNLRATYLVGNEATIEWMRSNANSYTVEYGLHGFTFGTGTVLTTPTRSISLTGLSAQTQYDLYVCSPCDTVFYTFTTPCATVTLPYSENFDSYTTSTTAATGVYVPCWSQIMTGTSTYQTGSYLPQIYYSSTYANSGSYSYRLYGIGYHMLPPMPTSLDSLQLSFSDYTTSASYGLEVGIMEGNTFIPVQVITSPASTHTDYTVYFGTYTGNSRIIAFRNYYTTSTTTYYSYHYIDDIEVDYLPTCPPVLALQVVPGTTTTTSASIDWTDLVTAPTWEVEYSANGVTNSIFVNAHPATINGLTPSTAYSVRVRPICSATDTGNWCHAISLPTGCDLIVPPYVQNFDEVAPTTYSTAGVLPPCWVGYTNGTSEIYTPHVVGSGSYWYADSANSMIMTSGSATYGDTKVVRLPQFATPVNSLTMNFWMSTESSSNGYLLVGYMTSDDVTTFVTVDSIHASSTTYHGSSSGLAALGYRDTVDFSAAPANAQFIAFKWVYTTSFYSCCVDDVEVISTGSICLPPTVAGASDVTYQSATINWNHNSATDFEVAVKAATDPAWPAEVSVTGASSYALTGLTPATTYQFRVRAICDPVENYISEWTEGTFTTDSLPCFVPEGFYAVETGYTTATFTWNADDSQNHWTIHVWNSGGSNEFDVESNPYIVTGLAQNTTYYAAIKAVCGGGAAESEYGDTIQFTTDQCAKVEGVSVSGITTNSAFVTWTSTGAPKYKVEYGDRNFNQGQGTTVVVEDGSTSVTLNNLRVNHNYSVFVMAVCEEGAEGAWSDRADFATLDETGVDVVDGSTNLSIYPNPTSDATTIALSGVNGEVTIVIVDMNGRTVATESMSCEGDCTKRMEVSSLAQGAYFVRVNGEGVNMVRKLVVK